MKKYIIHGFIILCLGISDGMAGVRTGIHAGISRTGLTGDTPEDASYISSYGFIGALTGEIAVRDDIGIVFGLQYLQKNTGVSYEISGQKDLRDSLDLRLTYITIPVLMRVYSSNRKTYVSGGFDLGFLRDGSLKNVQTGSGEDVTGWFKDIDLSLCLGFGIMIPVGDLFLDLEIKYAQSILAIGEMQELDLQQDMPIRIRTSGFQLNTGIAFDL